MGAQYHMNVTRNRCDTPLCKILSYDLVFRRSCDVENSENASIKMGEPLPQKNAEIFVLRFSLDFAAKLSANLQVAVLRWFLKMQ